MSTKESTMARSWFGKSGNTEIIDPYYEKPSGWRVWVRRIVGIVVLLALLYLFVWAAVWVYHSVTDDSTAGKNNSTSETKKDEPNTSGSSSTNSGSSSSNSSNGGSSTGSGGSSTGSSGGSTSTGSTGTSTTGGSSTGSTSTTGSGGSTSSGASSGTGLPHTGDDPVPGDVTNTTDVLPATGG